MKRDSRSPRVSSANSKMFGPWRKVRRLGGGGNGDVWLVKQLGRDDVALKVLRQIDETSYARFRSEVRVLSQNQDIKGLIPLIESYLPKDRAEGSPWYVMPLAIPCEEFLKGRSPVEIVRAFIELSETLAHLHERKISHRDIKPQNILAYGGRLCLSDFGLVKYPGREPLTPAKRDVGAKFTMAPEMRRRAAESDGEPADVFSFAKTLWIILTNQGLGFDGQYSPSSNIALKSFLRSTYTTKLDTLLFDCTQNDPKGRPRITEVTERLREWIAVEENFESRNAIEWLELAQLLFPMAAPSHVTWTDVDAICLVINEIGKVEALNHMFYPGGGGNTITGATRAREEGFIVIDALSPFLIKPASLSFESFGFSPDWNYFRFEAASVDPVGTEISLKNNFEYLTEIRPGEYGPFSLWERAQDDPEYKLPATARPILRYLGGSFVIFSTRSPYNLDPSTYDGRHDVVSPKEFREYIRRNAIRDHGTERPRGRNRLRT